MNGHDTTKRRITETMLQAVNERRYELFREGLQEAEATILIVEAADTKAEAIGRDLADKCRRLFIERINAVRTARGVVRGNEDFSGWQTRSAELYKAAAEVAAKTGGK